MYAKTKCTKQYVRSAISKQKIMYKILLYMMSSTAANRNSQLKYW